MRKLWKRWRKKHFFAKNFYKKCYLLILNESFCKQFSMRKMRNTTIHLPRLYLKLIDEIICDKDYPCTSEFIRVAIRKMLKRDMALIQNPRIEKTSEAIKELIAKQKAAGLQKSLDQLKLLMAQNPAVKKKLDLDYDSNKIKQTRIDNYWK